MFFKRISIYDQKIKNAYFGKGMVCVPSDAAPCTKSHTHLIAMFPYRAFISESHHFKFVLLAKRLLKPVQMHIDKICVCVKAKLVCLYILTV